VKNGKRVSVLMVDSGSSVEKNGLGVRGEGGILSR